MPITITPQVTSTAAIGWGIFTNFQSDFIGPLPTGSRFGITVYADADATEPIVSWTVETTTNSCQLEPGRAIDGETFGSFAAVDGDTVYVQAQLIQFPSTIVDSSTVSFPWKANSRDFVVIQHYNTGTGLSSAQAAQLARVDTATQVPVVTDTGTTDYPLSQVLSPVMLDTLTLVEITSGPTSGFVSSVLEQNVVGLICRVTNIDVGYAATSPDDGWYRPELAVINFFRGSDLVGRVGVHTVSRFIYPLPGSWAEWVTAFLGGTLPPDYSVQVTFATGNLGRVFYTKLP
jgi:hypothetical protein